MGRASQNSYTVLFPISGFQAVYFVQVPPPHWPQGNWYVISRDPWTGRDEVTFCHDWLEVKIAAQVKVGGQPVYAMIINAN